MTDRNTNSVRNIVYIIGKQVFWLLLNFIAKTVFVRELGKEFLGLNGLFNNMFLLFSFAEFGLGTSMLYSFYEPMANGDENKCKRLYCFYKKLYIIMSLTIMGIGILIMPIIPYLVDLDMPGSQVLWYYFLYILSSCISNLFVYKSYVLVADQKQYIVSKIQTILESLYFIAQICFVLIFKNFTCYLLCIPVKFALLGIYYSLKLKKFYPKISEKTYKLETQDKKAIYKNTKDLLAYKFSKVLIDCSDNVIISLMLGTIWVGSYSNYEFVTMGVWGFVSAFFSALLASVGNLIIEKKAEAQYRVYRMIELIDVWISGFVAVCLIVLFQDFIELWLGKEYLLNDYIMFVIVINIYLRSMRECTGMFREAAGLFSRFKNVTIITAILNIVLSIILGYFWGMFGIFFATTISVILTYYWYEPYLIHKELFNVSMKLYMKRHIKNVLSTLIMIAAVYGICQFFEEVTIPTFIAKIGICMIIPNLYYLIILGRQEEGKAIFMKLKTVWKRTEGSQSEKH